MSKGILLTKRSSFQVYAANYLYKKGIIDAVVFEGGKSSFPRKKNIFELIKTLNKEFSLTKNFLIKVLNKIFFDKYFGKQQYHNNRILIKNYNELQKEIILYEIENINDQKTFEILKKK